MMHDTERSFDAWSVERMSYDDELQAWVERNYRPAQDGLETFPAPEDTLETIAGL